MTTTASPAPAKARRLEEIARSKKGCFCITPTLITPEKGFNERGDYGDLESLATDIEQNGLLQPLKIRKETGTENIHLVDGHRRHKAITTILIPAGRWPADPKDPSLPAPVDCTAINNGTSSTDRLFMQLSMNTGKALTFLEEARLYKRILTADSTLRPADIARRTAKTKQAISDSLRLVNEGSDEIIQWVSNGEIAASTALIIIKQAGPDHQAQNELLDHTSANAGENHITPKHIPSKDKQEPAAKEPDNNNEEEEEEPEAQPEAPPEPTDSKSSTSHSTLVTSPSFLLYHISGAPIEPLENDRYHESERLALSNPPENILLFHLLSTVTLTGEIAYGYRINDTEQLPSFDSDALGLPPEEGYRLALDAAIEESGIEFTDEQIELLSDALFTAICSYYPEEGEPTAEPAVIPFTSQQAGQTGYDRIVNAPTSNRDGSAPSKGEGAFSAPDKQMEKLDKLLESISEKGEGDAERVTTAEVIITYLRNESQTKDLRNYLTGH